MIFLEDSLLPNFLTYYYNIDNAQYGFWAKTDASQLK